MQGKTAENRTYCHQLKSLWAYRQAHNLKVVGSNPTPATNNINDLAAHMGGFFASGCHLGANYFWCPPSFGLKTLVFTER